MLNVYKIADDYAESILEEFVTQAIDNPYEGEALGEIAEQYADDSEHVIYYGKAHEFVQALPFDRRTDAEQEVADCGMINENTTYDSLATLITYFALKMLILDAVDKRLESVRTPSYA